MPDNNESDNLILAEAWLLTDPRVTPRYTQANALLGKVLEEHGGQIIAHPDDDPEDGIIHLSISQEAFDTLQSRADIIDHVYRPNDGLAIFDLSKTPVTHHEISFAPGGTTVE